MVTSSKPAPLCIETDCAKFVLVSFVDCGRGLCDAKNNIVILLPVEVELESRSEFTICFNCIRGLLCSV